MRTIQHYQSIADKLGFVQKAFIDGQFVWGRGDERYMSVNPATGAPITEIAVCQPEDVDRAVAAARRAFDSGIWSNLGPAARKEKLLRLSRLILEHKTELAVMETLDSGKTIFDTDDTDIPDAALCFQWHAEAADKLEDSMTASDENVLSMVVRQPIGVVGAILPWNFPLQMAAWKLAPILASGNCAVVKPAQMTSLTLLKLAELAREAGIPDGVLNVVTGSGSVIGNVLARHMDIDMIAFTGSTEVGRNLLGDSGRSNLKRVILELGGKNPCVVFADVSDRDKAAAHIAHGAFWNMGENCSANSKILLHRDIAEDMTERILAAAQEWAVGNPLDRAYRNGALISAEHMRGVLEAVGVAKAQGARLLCGGERVLQETGGNFVPPTIFTGVTPDMDIFRKEIFGPVCSITTFDTVEEGIRLANDTEYGLHASVWTNDVALINRASRAIRAGTVSVNCFTEGDYGTPFGGFKQSGFFGRDKSLWANRQYTELKTIWIDAQ